MAPFKIPRSNPFTSASSANPISSFSNPVVIRSPDNEQESKITSPQLSPADMTGIFLGILAFIVFGIVVVITTKHSRRCYSRDQKTKKTRTDAGESPWQRSLRLAVEREMAERPAAASYQAEIPPLAQSPDPGWQRSPAGMAHVDTVDVDLHRRSNNGPYIFKSLGASQSGRGSMPVAQRSQAQGDLTQNGETKRQFPQTFI